PRRDFPRAKRRARKSPATFPAAEKRFRRGNWRRLRAEGTRLRLGRFWRKNSFGLARIGFAKFHGRSGGKSDALRRCERFALENFERVHGTGRINESGRPGIDFDILY